MTPSEVCRELRLVQEKYKDKTYDTFDVRISDMAKDAADAIDELLEKVIMYEHKLGLVTPVTKDDYKHVYTTGQFSDVLSKI